MPTIVFESGWTESHPRLRSDTNLWIIGGALTVPLVFTIQWSKLSGGRVEGVMEIYNRSAAGTANLLVTQVLSNPLYFFRDSNF